MLWIKKKNENNGDDDKIELYYTIIINDCLTYNTHVVVDNEAVETQRRRTQDHFANSRINEENKTAFGRVDLKRERRNGTGSSTKTNGRSSNCLKDCAI